MDNTILIFFLALTVIFLTLILIYQRFVFTRGIQSELIKITEKLREIMEKDSDEKIMVFTENKVLKDLDGQINLLLLKHQKVKADFKREEISSKKMLSNISHDIKTPLTVILGYLEIMGLNRPEDEMLKKAQSKAKEVMNLINQFFTLAKLESGDTNIILTKINITETCKETVLGFYDILLQKDFTVDISIPETAIFVQGEKDSISRILQNLLSNVIRYGIDGKYLGIALRQDENSVSIDVMDKGKGIPNEFASNVFDRLYTMEDSRNRDIQGNGLGLTIAKNLALKLGGDLLLTSEPWVKTIFTLRLKKF
ncbi:sensor histidine kinase [Lachnospiraceae bacterium 38-14]|jgi:Signal transduction histidine kinase|uniref:sensor histidine kinase n=1 Tax=Roseburia sp. 1XD42-69 TaxID=2320088 RepID=UPI000E9FFD63|nr:sensor histidine kinase [Roseburia sp. 1XD42-69]RKJ67153.1 sensor histidine kinase [Roseburia sp. 1XD42-69]